MKLDNRLFSFGGGRASLPDPVRSSTPGPTGGRGSLLQSPVTGSHSELSMIHPCDPFENKHGVVISAILQ